MNNKAVEDHIKLQRVYHGLMFGSFVKTTERRREGWEPENYEILTRGSFLLLISGSQKKGGKPLDILPQASYSLHYLSAGLLRYAGTGA